MSLVSNRASLTQLADNVTPTTAQEGRSPGTHLVRVTNFEDLTNIESEYG